MPWAGAWTGHPTPDGNGAGVPRGGSLGGPGRRQWAGNEGCHRNECLRLNPRSGGTGEGFPSSPPPGRPPSLNRCWPSRSARNLNSSLSRALEQGASSQNLSLGFLLKKEQDT